MTLRRSSLPLALLAVASTAACSSVCDREHVPNRGHAMVPDDLAHIAQYEAKNECWSGLYDLLSQKTRDKYSRLEWRIAFPHVKLMPPYDDTTIAHVIEVGTYIQTRLNPFNDKEALAYFSYREEGKPPLRLQLQLLHEPDEGDEDDDAPPALKGAHLEWRIALEDQVEDGVYPVFLGADTDPPRH